VKKSVSERFGQDVRTPRKRGPNPQDVAENTDNLRQLLKINRLKHSSLKKDRIKFQVAVRDFQAKESLVNVAKKMTVESSFLRSTCRSRFQKDTLKEDSQKKMSLHETDLINEVYCDNRISMDVPHKKHAGRKFMTVTINEAYQLYKEKATERGTTVRALSTFKKHRPVRVKLMRQIPDMGCACTTCVNAGLLHRALIKTGIGGLQARFSDNLIQTLCGPNDILKCPLKCIDRDCGKCGIAHLFEDICLAKNDREAVESWAATTVKYKVWENVTRTRTSKTGEMLKTDKPMKVEKETTIARLLMMWLRALHDVAPHVFDNKWQSEEYEKMKKKLAPGDILMVCDFGTNWAVHTGEEPQGVNWTRDQVTIHNSVCFFLCPECNILDKDEIAIYSDDLKHDWAAVDLFTDKMLNHLENRGINIGRLIRFSDNCAGQYRSKGPFWSVSTRKIPVIFNTFGANHGKKEADGFGGRNSQMVERAIKGGEDNITSAETMASFCQMKSDQIKSGKDDVPAHSHVKACWKIRQEDVDEVEEFCRRDDISFRCHGGRRCLIRSVAFTHRSFNLERVSTGKLPLGRTTFHKNIPSDVFDGFDRLATASSREQEKDTALVLPTAPALCPRQAEHNNRTYLCVNNISRDKTVESLSTIRGTLKIHCVRNTGQDGIVEVRRHSCLCDVCLNGNGGECPNVEPFSRCDIRGMTASRNSSFENSLWGGNSVVVLDKKFDPPESPRKQELDLKATWRRLRETLSLDALSSSDEEEAGYQPDEEVPSEKKKMKKRKRLQKKAKRVRRKLIPEALESEDSSADGIFPVPEDVVVHKQQDDIVSSERNLENVSVQDVQEPLQQATGDTLGEEAVASAETLQEGSGVTPQCQEDVFSHAEGHNLEISGTHTELEPESFVFRDDLHVFSNSVVQKGSGHAEQIEIERLDRVDLEKERNALVETSDGYSTPIEVEIRRLFFDTDCEQQTPCVKRKSPESSAKDCMATTTTADRLTDQRASPKEITDGATTTTLKSYYADSTFPCTVKDVEPTDRILRSRR